MIFILRKRNVKIFSPDSLESGDYQGARELSVLSLNPADWRVYRGVYIGETDTALAARTIASWGDAVPEPEAKGLVRLASLESKIKGIPYSD